jgi:hypothetical protein
MKWGDSAYNSNNSNKSRHFGKYLVGVIWIMYRVFLLSLTIYFSPLNSLNLWTSSQALGIHALGFS